MPGGYNPTPSASLNPKFKYEPSIDETKVLVFAGRGNLYGWLLENNSAGSDVYASFYDAASTAAVTVGTTTPLFTIKINAGSAFGRDTQIHPYLFTSAGLVVAVVSTRNGAGAPASAATGQFWFEKETGNPL